MKRKLLSILLALAMCLSLLPTFALAAPVYGDTNGHWAEGAIDRWSGYGVVNGKGEATFDPDGPMRRGEAAQMFANLLGLNKEGDISAYADAQGDWFTSAIAKCVAAGILNGKGYGVMDPNGFISREEFLTMYARAVCISNGTDPAEAKTGLKQKGFADTAQVSDWAADAIGTLVDKGYVNGMTATEIAPQANINRASVMALLDQSVSTYIGKDSTETTVAAKSEGITLIANPAVTTVTGTADVVVVAAGAEQYDAATGEIAHNDIRVESAKMPVARVQGENITVTLALSTTADDATVTETGVDSIIVIESTSEVKNAAVAAEGAKIIVKDGAKAETVTVAETAKSAAVETAKNATVGTLTIAAESATASVAGKVESVTVAETAKSATVETKSGSAVGTLNVAAEDAKTTVAGKVETVKVEETAKNVAVETTSTAKVTTVENKAENTAVTGSGSVGAVKSSEDVKIETKNTKVENTSETKDIAVTDSKGKETKVETKTEGTATTKTETTVNKQETSSGDGGGGHTHSYTYYAISDTKHEGKCSCGNTTVANHDKTGAGGACSVCGYKEGDVARIGSVYYASLDAAFENVKDGETITLLKNVTQDKLFHYNLGEISVTLDGANHKLTNTYEFKNDPPDYDDYDLGGGFQLGTCDYETPLRPTITVKNLTVQSAVQTLYATDTTDMILENCTSIQTKEESLPSEFTKTALEASYTSNLTVNSGNYSGKTYAIYAHNTGAVVTVNGGTFDGRIQADNPDPGVETKVLINGGTFTNCSFTVKEGASIVITGGTFSSDPTAYVPTFGYKIEENKPSTGKWTVTANLATDKDVEVSVSKTGTQTAYGTLAEFRDAVNGGNSFAGYTVTLLDDVNLAGVCSEETPWTPIGSNAAHPFSGIFDGDGCTISNLVVKSNNGAEGLFGYVIGENYTMDVGGRGNEYDYTFDMSDLASGFTAAVKSLTVKDSSIITTVDSGKKATGVIGSAEYAYIKGVHIVNTDVSGVKGVGGIAGNINGALVENCTTSNDSTVTAAQYNVGGIVGVARNAEPNKREAHGNVFVNCENNAEVRMEKSDSCSGYIGGIFGSGQNSSDSNAFVKCVNNGSVFATKCENACGIVGQCYNNGKPQYFVDCTNNGEITVSGECKYAAGIAAYATMYGNNVVNTVDISAPANTEVAGILAGSPQIPAFCSCTNEGTLTNSYEGKNDKVYDICSKRGAVIALSGNYDNVTALNNALNELNTDKTITRDFVLTNISIGNNDVALSIPKNASSFEVRDENACTSVTLEAGRICTTEITIPNATVNINASCDKSLFFFGANNIINVEAECAGITVNGNGSNITVNANLNGSLNFSGTGTVSATINAGKTVHCVRFHGTGTYTVNNYGTVTNEGGGGHVIYTESPCTFTVNNYGTIENTRTGATYALLFYGGCNATFNAYSGSTLSTTYQGLIMACGSAHSVKFNYQDGATLNNGGTAGTYPGLAWSSVVTVERITPQT